MMQRESTGQPDLARDTYMTQRQAWVLAAKVTSGADIMCPASAELCPWGRRGCLTPGGPFLADRQQHDHSAPITVLAGWSLTYFFIAVV